MVLAFRFQDSEKSHEAMVEINEKFGFIAINGYDTLMVTSRETALSTEIKSLCTKHGGILLREIQET